MMMTGRPLFRATTAPTSGSIPTNASTLPETMRRAGYSTIGIGKWHNDRAAFARGFSGGGPIFFGGMHDHSRMPVYDFDPSGSYPKTNERIAKVFSTELFADAAVKFLRQEQTKPFLLYVAFTAPHDPRMAPKEFTDRYRPEKISLPKNFLPEHPFDNGELKIRDEQLLPWPRTPEAVRREIAAYYAMITHLDVQIGRILDALEASGRARNTLIVFAGDNGLAVGKHGLLGKQNLYEHSVRVPLVFSGPGIPKGKKSDALCYLFDIFPTAAAFAGVPLPDGVEGRNLLPVMLRQQERVRDEVFGVYGQVQRMVRMERWKLIWYPRSDKTQLFDLRSDPDELRDVSNKPQHAARITELRSRLAAWMKSSGDPLSTRTP